MLRFINGIRGCVVFFLLGIGTIIVASSICLGMLFQRLLPKKTRPIFLKKAHRLLYYWTAFNSFILNVFVPTRWITHVPTPLNPDRWYLLISNHRSGADILTLYKTFNHQFDRFTFFLKRELLWQLPIAGLACYFLDFPFLVRHSKKDLRKHPELRGKDIETTKKACEKFKTSPCAIINFLEGTRFTPERHKRQKSPYQYLLKPKAAGIALVVNSMKDHLGGILDATIRYSTPTPTFWKLISGQIKTIEVTARILPVSPDLIGDYYNDRAFRKKLQQYLNNIWAEKDKQLTLQHQKENTNDD